ncbi:MAG TPA: DUF86 domain-containing protein [Thermoanaerobaculia bacterium]|nr:DUF86 domain-containing protein [Thermoanaerobaculia bacterium]
MVKPEVVGKKLARATNWLREAEEILSWPAEKFLSDKRSRDVATFYLFLAIQECIDLAAHWVADARWGSPDDAGGMFEVLADHRVIRRDLAEKLRGAVGLRNLIAHGYSLVDHQRIQNEYREGVKALWQFLGLAADEAGLEIEHQTS